MVVVSVFGRVGEQWQGLCRRLCFLCVLWITSCPCGITAAGEGVMSFSAVPWCPVPKDCMLESGGVAGSLSQPASGACIHLPLLPYMVVGFLLAVFHSVGSIPTTSGLPGKVQLCVNSELIGL